MPKLSSFTDTAPGNNQYQRKNVTEKATLQTKSHQHPQAKGDKQTSPKDIFVAHKKHPLHKCMQGVKQIWCLFYLAVKNFLAGSKDFGCNGDTHGTAVACILHTDNKRQGIFFIGAKT